MQAATPTPKIYDTRWVVAENCGRKNIRSIVPKKTSSLVDCHHFEEKDGVRRPPAAKMIFENPMTGFTAKKYDAEPMRKAIGRSHQAGFVFGPNSAHTATAFTAK